MDLGWEPLDLALNLEATLPLLDCLLVLILGRQHEVWNGHTRSVLGINHGGVSSSRDFECRARLGRQVDNLATPAVANNSPLFDARVFAFELL